ncbi:CpsB/CapC family capsule biosynthesis tyrosine phosphatase [uncultured Paraglaciecola sp.]|uniref:tyrosine-protein phosphatase n=1 Tax=uncultured Paraglaciecola sp. TaxID=1765024 RepID=UPI002594A9E5|nr:CpsB/CapC family capsule biosynthesis tyrosine phosphatase [uncultured Paraglaciecola sp.]
MIDLHSHILPGVDDGAQALDDSLTMLRMAVDSGVTTQVLTPHIHVGRYNNTKADLKEHFLKFRDRVDAENIPISLLLAAEMRIGPEIMNLTINDSIPYLGVFEGRRTFLLEFPRGDVPLGSDNLVKWLLAKNYLPVIVHPERNSAFLGRYSKLQRFLDLGCPIQITASSLTGKFGRDVQIMAEQLLLDEQVSAIASDCHNVKGRAPDLDKGFDSASKIIGTEHAKRLTCGMPKALLSKNPSYN